MWYLKFKAKHSDCIYAPKIIELGINTYFYPLGHYKKGNHIFASLLQVVDGTKTQIKSYEKYLKNNPSITKVERSENVIFSLSKHSIKKDEYTALYNPELFYPVPGHFDKEGYEVWEIASWNRKALEKVMEIIEKAKTTTYFEVLKLNQEIIKEVFLPKPHTSLSPKQKEVFELAVKNKYYSVPREITLDKLAVIMKISKPTLQEHLRKAEEKLLPFLK